MFYFNYLLNSNKCDYHRVLVWEVLPHTLTPHPSSPEPSGQDKAEMQLFPTTHTEDTREQSPTDGGRTEGGGTEQPTPGWHRAHRNTLGTGRRAEQQGGAGGRAGQRVRCQQTAARQPVGAGVGVGGAEHRPAAAAQNKVKAGNKFQSVNILQ